MVFKGCDVNAACLSCSLSLSSILLSHPVLELVPLISLKLLVAFLDWCFRTCQSCNTVIKADLGLALTVGLSSSWLFICVSVSSFLTLLESVKERKDQAALALMLTVLDLIELFSIKALLHHQQRRRIYRLFNFESVRMCPCVHVYCVCLLCVCLKWTHWSSVSFTLDHCVVNVPCRGSSGGSTEP